MDRRTFIHGSAAALTAAPFGRLPSRLSPAQAPAAASVRTVRTPILEVGYFESGATAGVPVVMLHGFPDDAHAYDGVAGPLAAAGHRALAVFLRGFGPTRFLDTKAPRMAEQAAIGQDVIDFADALRLPRVVVVGYDWGGRAAAVAAALHPDRVRAAVLIGGYSIQDTVTPGPPASPEAVRRSWYQWYFNTEVGRAGLEKNRRALCELMWREWSPTWQFTPELYAQSAASFDNPDFVDCVIHSYRHRHFNAPGEARFLEVEKRLAARPPIGVPAILLHGADDGFGRAEADVSAAERRLFPQLIDKRVVPGAGHFMPHEKPAPVAAAILEAIARSH